MTTEPSVTLNSKTLGFIIGFVTVVGFIVTATTFSNDIAFRTDRLEQDTKVISAEMQKITDKLDTLNGQLITLSITLNRLEDRLDAKLGEKKR